MSASVPAAATQPTTDAPAVTFDRLPNALAEGWLVVYDQAALEDVLRFPARPPLVRLARASGLAPSEDEVRAAERSLRTAYLARSRTAWGRTLCWLLAGPALTLLWINFSWLAAIPFFWLPPVARFIASRGAVSGGPILGVAVSLLPWLWASQRALRAAGQARRWRSAAAELGRRRYRTSPLRLESSAEVASFVEAAMPHVERLRGLMGTLAERGVEVVSEAAALCRSLYRLAAGHRLTVMADAYHALYQLFDAAEQRLSRLERGEGGILAERRVAGTMRRTFLEARRRLAPFTPSTAVSSRRAAPWLGALAGLAALASAWLLCGFYVVPAGAAAIVDPPVARLTRLATSLGLAGFTVPGGGSGDDVQLNLAPGAHLGWPPPFVDRHVVSTEEQLVQVRARFKPSAPDDEEHVDVLVVELRYTISDLRKWAAVDRDSNGEARLAGELSAILEEVLQRSRRDAGQVLLQQQPALADNQRRLVQLADQLVDSRMDDLVKAFASAIGGAQATQQAGVRLSPGARWQMLRRVPRGVAGGAGQ